MKSKYQVCTVSDNVSLNDFFFGINVLFFILTVMLSILDLCIWSCTCRYAFIYFAKEKEAVTTLQAMQKKVRLGDKILTVTPAISKEKATRQLNLPGKEINRG